MTWKLVGDFWNFCVDLFQLYLLFLGFLAFCGYRWKGIRKFPHCISEMEKD